MDHRAVAVDRPVDEALLARVRRVQRPGAGPTGARHSRVGSSTELPGSGADADSERFLILEGVARLLAAGIDTSTPLVVVLDDLHWVDAASLQLLRHLVTSAIPCRCWWWGPSERATCRGPIPSPAPWPICAGSRVSSGSISWVSKTSRSSTCWKRRPATRCPSEGVGLAHALRRETGGNPFFLVEVIRHLAETGVRPRRRRSLGARDRSRGAWASPPASVRSWPTGWRVWAKQPNGRCRWPR